jgi:hypothetical protein
MKNLNHSRSPAEPCDLCPSEAAILKLWRYPRLTDHPNFFTPSGGTRDLIAKKFPLFISNSWVKVTISDINQKVEGNDHGSDEQNYPLDDGKIPLTNRLEDEPAYAW